MIVPAFDAEQRRHRPYVWPKTLTKLLAGEDRCWWKAWYKSQHKYEKRASDPDKEDFFREYNEKHDAITNRRAQELRDAGWDVRLEDAAGFKLNGQLADVSGKPDVVALRGDEALVVDAKSGKPRESDHWQLLIYMFALPLSWLHGRSASLRGEIEYTNRRVAVRPLGDLERERIVAAIKLVASPKAPDATPSAQECGFCDVARCPVRYQAPQGDATAYF